MSDKNVKENRLRPHLVGRSSYRIALLSVLGVFLISFSLSSFYAKSTQDQNARDHQEKLSQQVATAHSYLSTVMEGYGRLLISSAALVSVKSDVSYQEWQQFYEHIDDGSTLPELVGLGYAQVVPYDTRDVFAQWQQSTDQPDFHLSTTATSGDLGVILYLAPDNQKNKRAIGRDMMTEPHRKKAMEQARDTAAVAMTAPVTLIQYQESTADKGVLMYYPVYDAATIPQTVEARRATIRGYVYAVMRPTRVLSQFYQDRKGEFGAIRVSDVSDRLRPHIFFATKTFSDKESASRKTLGAYGRTWQLDVSGSDAAARQSSPVVLFILGGIVSLLVSALTYWVFVGRIRRITRVYEGEVERTKEELLALASHQLRTPASGVKQYLGMLVEGLFGALSSEQQSLAQKAYDANERQLQIINEMLYVSKADAGQLVLEPKRFDLTTLTQTCIDEFGGQAAEKNMTITFMTKRHYMVTADPRYVAMAIENLISNAIKYSYPSSTVRVGISSRGMMTSLYVKDRGVGIRPDDRERVFGKFNRADNPMSHREGGSGLGLFLARELVRAHGGDISVDSELEKGSIFTMTLPKKLTVNETIIHLNRIKKIT